MHLMEVTCLKALRNSPQQLGGEFCSLARGLNTVEKFEGVQLSDWGAQRLTRAIISDADNLLFLELLESER